jgi:ABC-type maltose transport system permease subunit
MFAGAIVMSLPPVILYLWASAGHGGLTMGGVKA